MNDYLAAEWQPIFACNGLRSFDDFWKLEVKWFEEPNQRRGGWSGVARCELKRPEGGTVRVFLKRQENHTTRTFAHPWRGILTFDREFRAIMLYRHRGIPSLNPLYFACRTQDGKRRAILLTEELHGFRSLADYAQEWRQTSRDQRIAIIRAVAKLLRQIHARGLTHNCFYPKHIFLRIHEAEVEARVIDLEKTKLRLFTSAGILRDFRRLVGPGMPWSRAEHVRFFREYSGVARLTSKARKEWHRIARHYFEKRSGTLNSAASRS